MRPLAFLTPLPHPSPARGEGLVDALPRVKCAARPLPPCGGGVGERGKRSRDGRWALRRRAVTRQRGAAAVEFAFIALFAFLPLLLAVVEFGRLFYVVGTVQEVTRRAARQQVVSWISESGSVQRQAVFQPAGGSGAVTLPGGVEVSNSDVRLSFHTSYADAVDGVNPVTSGTPQSNFTNCLKHVEPCVRYVRASLEAPGGGPISYAPMVGWFGDLFSVPLPSSTVIMPSESLGLP